MDAYDEVVGRYEELKKEAKAEGRRIRDAPREHTGKDATWQMVGETTKYLIGKRRELVAVADRYKQSDEEGEERYYATDLLSYDLGDYVRRPPFEALTDSEQDDFLTYCHILDNPPIDQPIDLASSRAESRRIYDEYDTLVFKPAWVYSIESNQPLPYED